MRRLTLAALALVLASGTAMADALSEAVERGTIRLGVRTDSPPFSIGRADGGYSGYQIDICQAIVAEISRAAGKPIAPQFVVVDAGNRFRMVAEKRVDLLCEPTSVTLGRRAEVDFSIPTFVTGAGLMGRLSPGPVSVPPLGGGGVGMPANPPRRLGVLAGTTTERTVKSLVAAGALSAQVIDVATHGDGITALSAGLLDGYAADLEILIDLRSRTTTPENFVIADRLMSLETYGIAMGRGETALRLAADRAIARLYREGGIAEIAQRHFPGRAPGDAFTAMVLLNALAE
ncbi:MAG: amino acid ABC transporter substrate-binding protein [Acetobacteraceae bacterium]|jgi:polar amino acid transport system substrate-binding protein/glutamate/aspartate transport system substrate-binding protein|nr:amino acid ABC transporter substrate-binding protein [Acetobacteraceae bacterium]